MIPLQLTLRNFLSYRDEATIDFTNIRIACLSGDNGAGKSALLDAITWALWGETRTPSDRDVISIGAIEMEVTFVFRLGDREYRVFRRRSTHGAGRLTIELEARAPGDDTWSQITGDSARHTQEKISRLLNLDHETFVNSAFILQGKADSFTEKPPRDRKKILGNILNLREYDDLQELSKQEERALRERLSAIRGQMDELDSQLTERPSVMDELAVTMRQLTDLGQQLDIAQQQTQLLRLQLETENLVQRQIAERAAQADREERELGDLRSRLAGQRSARERFSVVLAQADEIERGWKESQHWGAEVGRLAALGRDDQAQQQIAHDAQRAIDAEEALLRRAVDAARHEARSANEQLARLDQRSKERVTLQTELDEAGDPTARLARLDEELTRLRRQYSSVDGGNRQLLAQLGGIDENLGRLDQIDAICPTCRRPLSEHDRDQIREGWMGEGQSLRERGQANEVMLQELQEQGERLKLEQKALEQVAHNNAGRVALIGQITGQLAGREAEEQRLQLAIAEEQRLETRLTAGDFATGARSQLIVVLAARRALGYDARVAEHAARKERELAPFASRRAELVDARSGANQAEAVIAEIGMQIAEREAAHSETVGELERIRRENPRDPGLRDRYDTANDALDRLTREKNAFIARQGHLEGRINTLDRLQDHRDELDREATGLELDYGATKVLVEAFGRNGIQAMIVEGVLPELEDEANRLLRQMSTGQLEVSFRSQRQLQSRDSVAETLDIIIRDEAGERLYALYSGGEAFRVNFAIRVALSKLLARRAGASIDMLVIDEGFGTQDARGRDGLIEALRSIEDDFQTILVITHIGEIRELFPTRIDVVKTDRGSQVTVC